MTQDQSASRYSNTWSGDEFLGEVQRVLIERGLTPPEWPSRTPTERDFAINSCAGWCEDRLREIEALKAELAAVRSEQQPSEQGSKAIALIALLGDTAPIRRWKEYEDRGEERIPCFIDVETAKAIAEFFPQSNERPDSSK